MGVKQDISEAREHLQKYPNQGNALPFQNSANRKEPKYLPMKECMWYNPCSIQWNITQRFNKQLLDKHNNVDESHRHNAE